MDSAPGRRLAAAKLADATALLELSPNALLFGSWHSQGQGGGLGAKFPRVLVSEIIGVDTPVEEAQVNRRTGEIEPRPAGRRTGSRIDPAGIRKGVTIYKDKDANWNTTRKGLGAKIKNSKPSEINHGNITPSIQPLGVTCAYAEHRVVITCAGLRRLRFGSPERNDAGRAIAGSAWPRGRCRTGCPRLLAALPAATWSAPAGPKPRSSTPTGSTEPVRFDRESATDLYREAYRKAEAAGFAFESLTLDPQPKLVEIIRQSREMALAGRGGDEGDS